MGLNEYTGHVGSNKQDQVEQKLMLCVSKKTGLTFLNEKAMLLLPVFSECASTMNSSPENRVFVPVIPFPNLPRTANGGM